MFKSQCQFFINTAISERSQSTLVRGSKLVIPAGARIMLGLSQLRHRRKSRGAKVCSKCEQD